MTSVRTETETVIKRVLPYLRRRGYDVEADLDFETPAKSLERYNNGYVDVNVTCGRAQPVFIIEAKRTSRKLTAKDRDQALAYGRSLKVLFVVVTNGQDIQIFNTDTGEPIRWDGRLTSKIPRRDQLPKVVSHLKANRKSSDVPLSSDSSLPFRPGLPLKQLNGLFARCHTRIRNIEKSDKHDFADFSKLLFLKLLEEKSDASDDFKLPYTYRFFELAEKPAAVADQVKDAVNQMLDAVRKKEYGDVLVDPIHLKDPKTYHYIVQQLAGVSFTDSGLDTKGAAFEYFVRATLKGKRLGQYFTPRPLVELMTVLIGRQAIVGSLMSGVDVRVLDPACGTGGFLVFLMKDGLSQLGALLQSRRITKATHDSLAKKLKEEVFHGSDANEGVASAAKMNMIIAGDGHNNIRAEDSLPIAASVWDFDTPIYDFVVTNPPFGTSESSSLSAADLAKYDVPITKGQLLFLQRMVRATLDGGLICTVIDEGVLNTDSAALVRRWLLERVELVCVVRLPADTFKPNKINVRSSVLLMRKRAVPNPDLDDNYTTTFVDLQSLGYYGSGESVRGFDFAQLKLDAAANWSSTSSTARSGQHWTAFDVSSVDIAADPGFRMDLKYWEPALRLEIESLVAAGARSLANYNTIETARGKSPAADLYVDEADGHAVVVKAGCLTPFGEILLENADFIEKALYDDIPDSARILRGDVLLASTGDGTLGKAAVYSSEKAAIADGHVTIIRPNAAVDPYFLCDYLRAGFGKEQIARLYSGSTGLIELTPGHVNAVVIDVPGNLAAQKARSSALRAGESRFREAQTASTGKLVAARSVFRGHAAVPVVPLPAEVDGDDSVAQEAG